MVAKKNPSECILNFRAKKYLFLVGCPERPIPSLGLLGSRPFAYSDVPPSSAALCEPFHSTRERKTSAVQKVLINALNRT